MIENVLRTHDFIRFAPFRALVITKETKVATFSSIAKAASAEGYIRHCEAYLANGDWIDDFYGEFKEGRVTWETIAG